MNSSVIGSSGAYAVIHLVSGETSKELIGPQVVDHMAWQQAADGTNRPASVGIGFVEPGRIAASPQMRSRLRVLQARAPRIPMALLPVIGRLSAAVNGRFLARRAHRLAGPGPVVFHCRGESAVEWAMAMVPHLSGSGIVADIRGAWPEELLFARGYDGPDGADVEAITAFHTNTGKLHLALAQSGAVLSVSAGMLDWLHGLGVDRKRLHYVPCCVSRTTFRDDARERARAHLGLAQKLVFAYMGTITRYQHVEDGVIPVFRALAEDAENAHLLCITEETDRMRGLLTDGGIATVRATVLSAAQAAVADLLSAADAGFLLRAPSRINRYSQPTKLAEYLAAGVPVIVSRGTGDVDRLMETNQAGLAISCFGVDRITMHREAQRVLSAIGENGTAMRANALALCERAFLWSRFTEIVRTAYCNSLSWQASRRN